MEPSVPSNAVANVAEPSRPNTPVVNAAEPQVPAIGQGGTLQMSTVPAGAVFKADVTMYGSGMKMEGFFYGQAWELILLQD